TAGEECCPPLTAVNHFKVPSCSEIASTSAPKPAPATYTVPPIAVGGDVNSHRTLWSGYSPARNVSHISAPDDALKARKKPSKFSTNTRPASYAKPAKLNL